MDFLAEYDEMNCIPSKIAVTYKFFELFRVCLKDTDDEKRGFYWSVNAVDTELSDEILVAFKTFLKAKRSELKKCKVSDVNCGKMLWFFYHKLLEVGAFNDIIRRDIMAYMDICEYIIM
jgi:hypothetical protein